MRHEITSPIIGGLPPPMRLLMAQRRGDACVEQASH